MLGHCTSVKQACASKQLAFGWPAVDPSDNDVCNRLFHGTQFCTKSPTKQSSGMQCCMRMLWTCSWFQVFRHLHVQAFGQDTDWLQMSPPIITLFSGFHVQVARLYIPFFPRCLGVGAAPMGGCSSSLAALCDDRSVSLLWGRTLRTIALQLASVKCVIAVVVAGV